MKSKIYITILIVMIIFSSITISNFKSLAATTANIIVDTKNVVQGKEVEVNIKLQNNVEFSAANFVLNYDQTKLEYKNYSVGGTLKKSNGETDGTILINKNTSGQLSIGYMADASQTSETKSAGDLLKLTFVVNSGAGTSTDLKLEVKTLKKDDGTDVTSNITNGELRIISGIKTNKSSLSLKVGDTSTLSVSTLPMAVDISNEIITWKSDNTSIANVNSDGVVTAVAAGTTKITATVLGLTAQCSVTIEKETIPLEAIYLSETQVQLTAGENKTLQITYKPTNTTDSKNAVWTSSNKDVATVDSDGKITAISAGTAVITATVGTTTATCTVTVVESLSISLDKTNLTLPCHQIKQLNVIYNQEIEEKNVTWYSSDETIATVDQNGLVTALKKGTAIIKVKVNDLTASCKITVSGELGDFDKDDNITAFDAYKVLETSVDISLGKNISDLIILTSDVNKDKDVTAQDAYNVLEYSVGLINKF